MTKDVNFYDYDGTLVAAYTCAQAQALTALPPAPSHDGLTFDGWNYTLSQVNGLTGKADIGAMYITSDGKTRLNITIAALGRMTVPLYITQTVSNGVTIDWGDGSATGTLSGTGNVNTSHTYSAIGNYIITLAVASGCILDFGDGTSTNCILGGANNLRVYPNMLQAIHIGSRVTSIGNYAFSYCSSLASITIPSGVTSIGAYAFAYCYSLASITIPSGVTSIGYSAFISCCSVAFYDFTSFTSAASAPTLADTHVFDNMAADCRIRVPSALADAWKTATTWHNYASYIVGV